jgi:hypothetical protein
MANIKPMRTTSVAPTMMIWEWGSLGRMLGIREAMILSHCCWSEYRAVYLRVGVEIWRLRDTAREGKQQRKERIYLTRLPEGVQARNWAA